MIQVTVEMANLKPVIKELTNLKDKSKLILRDALNDTAKEAKKYMYSEAYSTYVMKSAKIKNDQQDIKKASSGNLTATVITQGTIKEAYNDYRTYRLSKNGWSAKITRADRAKPIVLEEGGKKYKAFLVKYPISGHVTLAQRIPGQLMDPSHAYSAYGTTKKEAIRNVYSPSVPKQMGFYDKEGTYSAWRSEKTMTDVSKILQNHMTQSLEKFLGGAAEYL